MENIEITKYSIVLYIILTAESMQVYFWSVTVYGEALSLATDLNKIS
jgi:hypothetical protein